jgi:hypothetical protein
MLQVSTRKEVRDLGYNQHFLSQLVYTEPNSTQEADARTDTHILDADKSTPHRRNHMDCVSHVCANIIKNYNFECSSLFGSHEGASILRNVNKYLPFDKA